MRPTGSCVLNGRAPEPDALLPRARRDRILEMLEEHGAVRVATLATHFAVAEETIRRDLDRLAQHGRLVRTHGGATPLRSDRVDGAFEIRDGKNSDEKQRIAAAALPLVEGGDVIALDASTTALRLAALLPDVELQIITNGLHAAQMLSERRSFEVTLIGGRLGHDSSSLLGPIAERTLGRYAIDKAFLSCKGIDPLRGMSEADMEHAEFKRLLLEVADSSCLLVDHSKFGVRSSVFFGPLTDVDTVVTDSRTDREFLAGLPQAGVDLVVA